MIKHLKLYFLSILYIIILAALTYMERNALCNSYNREVDLHVASYINKEDSDGKKSAQFFSEQSKNQFANKLDNLILIIFFGFATVILSQRNINKKQNRKLSKSTI